MIDIRLMRGQLIDHEGVRLGLYQDTVGKTTIGVGRNLTDNGISRIEALFLLDNDIEKALIDLQTFDWWTDLSDVRQRAMVDMRFNLGPIRFRGFHHLLAALDAKDYHDAARQMRQSQWAMQVGQRAETLAKMMESGS